MYGPEVMTVYHYYWENRLAEFRNMDADTDFTLENLAADRLILGDLETCTRRFIPGTRPQVPAHFSCTCAKHYSSGPATTKSRKRSDCSATACCPIAIELHPRLSSA